MEFEWDSLKNATNLDKHGLAFEEAALIFNGPVLTEFDESFEYGELREISYGLIRGLVVALVVHTQRNDRIRIISARLATPPERKKYYEYLG